MSLAAETSALLAGIANQTKSFEDTLALIDKYYDYTPATFYNGSLKNPAKTNEGSCKVLSFAKLNDLNQLDTLALFAEHYREVKEQPGGTTHANIRQFLHKGWRGIRFDHCPLKRK